MRIKRSTLITAARNHGLIETHNTPSLEKPNNNNIIPSENDSTKIPHHTVTIRQSSPIVEYKNNTRSSLSSWWQTLQNNIAPALESLKTIPAAIQNITKSTLHEIKKIAPIMLIAGCSMMPQDIPNNSATDIPYTQKDLYIPTQSTNPLYKTDTNAHNNTPENIFDSLEGALQNRQRCSEKKECSDTGEIEYANAYNGYAVSLMEKHGTLFPELLAFPAPQDNPQEVLIQQYAKTTLLNILKDLYPFLDEEGADATIITEKTIEWVSSLSLDQNQFAGSIKQTNFKFSSKKFNDLPLSEKILALTNYIQYLAHSSEKGSKNEQSSLFPFLKSASSESDFAKKIALLLMYPSLVPNKAKPIPIENGAILSRANAQAYIAQKFEHFLGSPIIRTIDEFVVYPKKSAVNTTQDHNADISSYPIAFQTIVNNIFNRSIPRISSPFGWRTQPTEGASTNHKGIDFSAEVGTPLYAPFDGTVISAGWNGGYGNEIIVQDQKTGIQIQIAHLNRMTVQKGDSVKKGERIAFSGNTGTSTGPHVHVEIRINNTAIDPKGFDNKEKKGNPDRSTTHLTAYHCGSIGDAMNCPHGILPPGPDDNKNKMIRPTPFYTAACDPRLRGSSLEIIIDGTRYRLKCQDTGGRFTGVGYKKVDLYLGESINQALEYLAPPVKEKFIAKYPHGTLKDLAYFLTDENAHVIWQPKK